MFEMLFIKDLKPTLLFVDFLQLLYHLCYIFYCLLVIIWYFEIIFNCDKHIFANCFYIFRTWKWPLEARNGVVYFYC